MAEEHAQQSESPVPIRFEIPFLVVIPPLILIVVHRWPGAVADVVTIALAVLAARVFAEGAYVVLKRWRRRT